MNLTTKLVAHYQELGNVKMHQVIALAVSSIGTPDSQFQGISEEFVEG